MVKAPDDYTMRYLQSRLSFELSGVFVLNLELKRWWMRKKLGRKTKEGSKWPERFCPPSIGLGMMGAIMQRQDRRRR